MNWNETLYWNSKSYGNAIKIKKGVIISILCFLCLVTPFTNVLIPFIVKKSKDIIWRY